MKRTITAVVLALVIGALVSSMWSNEAKVKPLAGKVSSSEERLSQKSSPSLGPQWETLPDGTKVLRVWEKIGPDWPQIALFYLTNDLYRELGKDPSTFVNTRKIFPKDVRPHAKLIEVVPPPKSYDGAWVVVCGHHPGSAMPGCTGFTAEEVPPAERR